MEIRNQRIFVTKQELCDLTGTHNTSQIAGKLYISNNYVYKLIERGFTYKKFEKYFGLEKLAEVMRLEYEKCNY